MKIGLVGPYPPPYGGISVHIKRMEHLLLARGHHPVIFKEMTVKQWLLSNWGKWHELDIVHFHEIEMKNRILLGILGLLRFNVALSIHGDSLKEQLENSGWLQKYILSIAMRQIPHTVVVKDEIRETLRSMGVEDSKISVINAYLPYRSESMGIPDEIAIFLDTHHPILVANGYDVVPISESADLYGIQLTINLSVQLKKEYPKLGFLFFLSQIGDEKAFGRLKDRINQTGLHNHYAFILGEDLVPTLSQATLFIRPTYQDGYGISVSEAIDLGIPAVASDVCVREPGTILFRSGDLDDLYIKVQDVLNDYESAKQRTKENKPQSGFDKLISIYEKIMSQ